MKKEEIIEKISEGARMVVKIHSSLPDTVAAKRLVGEALVKLCQAEQEIKKQKN